MGQRANIADASAAGHGGLPARLADRLRAPCVIVVAPGGAGKSTMLRRLAERDRRVTCRTLGPEHRDVTTIDPVIDPMLEALASSDTATVAIDDAHQVLDSPAEAALERLVACTDEEHRVVIASRLPPRPQLLHASPGEVEIVTAPELSLRIDEIAETFRVVGGHALGLECASRVASETGGWAALVHRLAVLSRLVDPDALEATVDVVMRGDFATALLEDALHTLPPAVARALEETSALPMIRLAECTRLIGADDATELLAAVDGGAVMHVVELGRPVLPPVLRRHLQARRGVPADDASSRGSPPAEAPLALDGLCRPKPPGTRASADAFDAAIARLRAGDVVGAVPLLHRASRAADRAADRTDDPESRQAARLLLLVLREPITPRDATLDALAALERECVALGQAALARVIRGAIAAIAGLHDHATQAVVEEFEVRRDERGAALTAGIDLLVRARRGRASSADATALAQRLDRMGSTDVATWTRAAAALLAAASGGPHSHELIRDAETAVIATRIDAASAFLDAARALTDSQGRSEALLASARRRAMQAGLPRLPVPLARSAAGARAPTGAAPASADPRHPHLTVGCFGGFRLRADGAELDLRAVRPQARALLRMLALNSGSPLHRELIADILWGDLGTDSAVHALHVSVSSLRKALPRAGTSGSIVERVGEAYRLGIRERHDCDLAEFDDRLAEAAASKLRRDAAATAGSLRRALALYVGDVLPEDGPAEWVTGARERYRTRAAEAASSLAHLELHLGEPRAAVAAASRAVEIDPWLDESWRTLVTVHRSSGDVVAAERAAEDYRRMRLALGIE